MKATHLLICLLIIATPSIAQVPAVAWANKVTGSASKSLGIDPQGNLYTIGFTGIGTFVDVDPGPGTHIVYGDSGTVLLYKFSSAGSFVWVKQLPFGVTAECIRADAAQNVYVIGTYGLTKDFDPGPAVFELTGKGQNDVFILKMDVDGNFIWAKSYGGTTSDVGLSLTIAANGDVYSTGYYDGTSDFDPGPGVYNLATQGQTHCFIAALNSAGNFLWAQEIDGGFNQGYSIVSSPSGGLLIGGVFGGTVTFGSETITSAGGGDVFIMKLTTGGIIAWTKTVGSIGTDQDVSVALGPNNEAYATGSFKFPIDMDPGPVVHQFTPFGLDDIFVLKLAANGTFQWAKQLGGPSPEAPRAITTDAAGNVYTTGLFQDTADFDPGPGVYNLVTYVGNNTFISKLNSDGSFGWAAGFGTDQTSADRGEGVMVDATGNVYLAGTFQGNVDFDPGPGEIKLLSSIQSNFLMKFGSSVSASIISIANGNWNNAAIWSGGAVPSTTDSVIVKHAVTITANAEVNALRVENPGGNLVIQTGVNLKITH